MIDGIRSFLIQPMDENVTNSETLRVNSQTRVIETAGCVVDMNILPMKAIRSLEFSVCISKRSVLLVNGVFPKILLGVFALFNGCCILFLFSIGPNVITK